MSANGSERILRLKSVLERTGLSRSTVYRKVQSRTFPKPLKISERCIGWRESDVESWLRSLVLNAGTRHCDALFPD
jgi:prophage regulatory protein